MGLTKAERKAADELHAIVYLPCEGCGQRKFTMLRGAGEGKSVRLCTECARQE